MLLLLEKTSSHLEKGQRMRVTLRAKVTTVQPPEKVGQGKTKQEV